MGADHLTKRSLQLSLLKEAALRLAARDGEVVVVSGIPVTEVKLRELYLWLTPFGPRRNLDVWDESRGGAKVLNINWDQDQTIEVVSFKCGDWEKILVREARGAHH